MKFPIANESMLFLLCGTQLSLHVMMHCTSVRSQFIDFKILMTTLAMSFPTLPEIFSGHIAQYLICSLICVL